MNTIEISKLKLHENIRKDINPEELNDLVDSIKQHGILQPILVRTGVAGEFEIIAGQRRYLAAKAAGLTEIPVMLRDIVDSDITELQIIENLNRADLTPIDECDAYVALMEAQKIDAALVAVKVGKHHKYVMARLKLHSLIEVFRVLIRKGQLSLELGIRLGSYDNKAQTSIYKEVVPKGFEGNLQINNYIFNRYQGDLKEVSFELSDTTLIPAVGSCTGCPYNTASANLFGDANKPRCTRIWCFEDKVEAQFRKIIAEAVNDPGKYVFVTQRISDDEDKDVVKQKKSMIDAGLTVIDYDRSEYSKIDTDAPVLEDYIDENENYSAKERKEIEKQFKVDLKAWEEDQLKIADNLTKGIYKYVVPIHGSQKGMKYVCSISKPLPGKSRKIDVKSDNVTTSDLLTEIERLKEREKRAKQLDQEKINASIITAIKEHNNYIAPKQVLNKTETELLRAMLYDMIPYQMQSDLQKAIGSKTIEEGMKLPEKQFAYIVRHLMMDKYGKFFGTSKDNAFYYSIAESLGIDMEQISIDQMEIAATREARVKEKIVALQKQLKEKPSAKIKKEVAETA